MAPIDQHQLALAGVARYGTRFPVTVNSHVDQRNDDIEWHSCRVRLVISEVAVKILCDKVVHTQERDGNGVVFLAGNQTVGLFLAECANKTAGLIDGITQAVYFALVAVAIDNALATLDHDQQHEKGG